MELVSMGLQLASSASCWQHQKEISGQTASASLLLWRQPLYQPKSSHLSLAPFEEPQQIAEHGRKHCTRWEQEVEGTHRTHKKPNQIPGWAGKGDERVTAASLLPGTGSGTCTPALTLYSDPSMLLLLLLQRHGPASKPCAGAPKGLAGRQSAVSHGGFCLLCSLSVTAQIFAFWQIFHLPNVYSLGHFFFVEVGCWEHILLPWAPPF